MNPPQLKSIELFTGAGGLALGTAAAGFDHRLLLEYNRDACKTLRANQSAFGSDCEVHEGDVKQFSFDRFADIDLVAAGAPCQPFSIGGKHRAHRDDRNLFPQVFRAVREARPKTVIIENVKGLLRSSLSDFVEYVELQLSYPEIIPDDPLDPANWSEHLKALRRAKHAGHSGGLTYSVGRVLLNSANFGVPQVRERVFFVALRRDLDVEWVLPKRTHSEAALRLAQQVTGAYWERHGLRRKTHPTHPHAGKWLREAGKTAAWQTVRDALRGLPEPVASVPNEDWPNHIGQSGARSYPGHTGSPLDRPAKTLKAGVHGVPGGENMLRRPNGTVRYFTVREAARIQTFPDDYIFSGAWGEAMRQIGNAVPVCLAQAVARSVAQALARAVSAPHQRRPQSRPLAEQVEIPELLIASA
jgi:DNA (cytosine-5)-methyltransferase 1